MVSFVKCKMKFICECECVSLGLQMMQMQVCRGAARSPTFSPSAEDFSQRFAIYSPSFWMQALMGSTNLTSGSYAGVETLASALLGTAVGPLGMLLQGVYTCTPGQYLTSGCFMRYPSLCCSTSIPLTCFELCRATTCLITCLCILSNFPTS